MDNLSWPLFSSASTSYNRTNTLRPLSLAFYHLMGTLNDLYLACYDSSNSSNLILYVILSTNYILVSKIFTHFKQRIFSTVAVELHPLNLKRFYDAYFRLGKVKKRLGEPRRVSTL